MFNLQSLGKKRTNIFNRLLQLFFILLFNLSFVMGDNSVDSLKQIIHGDGDGKAKVDAYYKLAIEFSKTQNPEMITYVIDGLELSEKINYHLGIGRFNMFLFQINENNLEKDTLFNFLVKAIEEFNLAKNQFGEANALNLCGIFFERQGKYRIALKYYYQALFIFQNTGDEKGVANEKNNIGLIHQLQKHYTSAIFFYNQAIQIGQKLNDLDVLANAYNNMAICYQEQRNPTKALKYFELVYEIDLKENNPSNLALSYNNLGVIQCDMGNYDLSKELLFNSLNQKKLADEYLDLSNTFNNLATVYQKTHKYDSAIYFLNLAIPDAKKQLATPNLSESYKIYSEILEAKGDFAGSLKYRKLSSSLIDSLNFTESQLALNQLENEFQQLVQEKNEVERIAAEEKSSLQTSLYLLGIIVVLIIVIGMVYYVVKVKNAYKNLQLKQKKIEVQNKILQVKNIEVVQAKEAAEEAANTKTQFISTISHEIRTPLNAIIGVSNLLQQSNPKDDQVENLNILKISSENLLQLVNNILDFSKMEAGKLQLESIDFNLRNLVFDVKELFSIKAMEKGIELMINFDDKIPAVLKGDPLRINQLLINLVNNAIKFTETGYVRIEIVNQLSTINHALIHFAVTDTGIGIHKSKQEQIFQSFTQADSNTTRKFGGTGLGLSICKRILENLNSKLQIESVVGRGSKFYFTINFDVSRNASIGKSSRTASFEDSIKGKRVLVVEDNMMNIMVIRQFLQKWGVITEVALNGREGYNRVVDSNFDAVLMDIHMPEMDGIEATMLIRKLVDERKKNIPIIALTAENEMQFRQKVYEVGMNDYIFKPFNPDDLKERLGYALFNSNNGNKRTPAVIN
ncbi:MAG: response regulator [Bacteroidia bacterium]|nr:response regulator [Bacteroidia bacterium]MCF8425950.1 response regulator [Bacteroidia bacterium]MCF8446287.1 response regulator [Bacteroidia bacterium]